MANNRTNKNVSDNVLTAITDAFKGTNFKAPTLEEIQAKRQKALNNGERMGRSIPKGSVLKALSDSNSGRPIIEVVPMDNGNYWFAVNCEGGKRVNLARLLYINFTGYGTSKVEEHEFYNDAEQKRVVEATATEVPNTVSHKFVLPQFNDVYTAYEAIMKDPSLIAGKEFRFDGIVTREFKSRSEYATFSFTETGKMAKVLIGYPRALTAQVWTLTK